VVTEAGFGADLGAEKFFDIKCRKGGLVPGAAVIVATLRALKLHGGAAEAALDAADAGALAKGFANLARHVENTRRFGVPVLVALNRFSGDRAEELHQVEQACAEIGATAVSCDHWARGGAGAETLARVVVETLDSEPAAFRPLYPDDLPLWEKTRTIAQDLYGAQGIIADQKVRDAFRRLQEGGYGHYPVCIAKTPLSFSTDPQLKGAPARHVVPVREVRLAAGAEFIVVVCGDIMTMPGLPRVPSAARIRVAGDGRIDGLA
jgi:formate--tetrahydrofolate ligase